MKVIVRTRTELVHDSELTTGMHRLRGRVFKERLDWDVSVCDGLEIDRYDTFEPTYLLAIEQRDVGADNSIAEPSLQLAEFCRGSFRSAGGRRLVTRQLRPRNREVAGQWLADNHPRSAKLPVPGQNRDQLSHRLDADRYSQAGRGGEETRQQ